MERGVYHTKNKVFHDFIEKRKRFIDSIGLSIGHIIFTWFKSLDKVEVVSPCPFLKKVEVASDGGGTTIPAKVMKVASSPHSLKKMEVASPHHPFKNVEVAFPSHFLEKVEVASPLPSLKNVAIHIYIYI